MKTSFGTRYALFNKSRFFHNNAYQVTTVYLFFKGGLEKEGVGVAVEPRNRV